MLKFPVLLACGLLVVAGCSGSGGGPTPPRGGQEPPPGGGFDLEQIFDEVDPDQLAPATGRAAKANPIPGSFTQSADDGTINVVIANFGEASATFTVTNTRRDNSERWSVNSDDAEIIDGDLMFEAAAGTGTVYAGLVVETNIGEDEDYLAYGLWADVPATGTPDIGVFVDSNDEARFTAANVLALTGTAMYEGGAFGVYSDQADEEGQVSSFTGTVALTASFEDAATLGTISGAISDLTDVHDNVYEGSTIDLLGATIEELPGSADTIFFDGSTSSTVTIDGSDEDFFGRWGGQFFVNGEAVTNHPENVAGTFGLANEDNTRSFLGVFITRLEGGSGGGGSPEPEPPATSLRD